MRTTLFLILTALLMTTTAFADDRTAALDYEPKLDKAITLSLRAAPLKEVLVEVEKATGMHLLVQREISEDKATVWVKDQPAREVLRALAHCFNLGWSPSPRTADKPYLRLWMDRDYLTSMADRDRQDQVSIMEQWDKELKASSTYLQAGATPYEPPRELMAKLTKDDVPEYHRLERRGIASNSTAVGAAVLQFLALTQNQRDQLYAGEHVTVSGAEIGADVLKRWPEAKSFDFATERSISGPMLRCAIRPSKVGGTNLMSSAYWEDSAYVKEADMAAKRVLADLELDKPLPEGAKIASEVAIAPGEGSAAVPATMSDGLIELAKMANTPVVAQYASEYRAVAKDWDKLKAGLKPSTAKKVGERVAELGREHVFTVDREGQILVAKCLLWHRLRLREAPEANIRAWQKEASGLPFPTFEGFVSMGAMRWEQIRGAIENEKYFLGVQTLIHLARCE